MTLKPNTKCAARNCNKLATAMLETRCGAGTIRFPVCAACFERLTAKHRTVKNTAAFAK